MSRFNVVLIFISFLLVIPVVTLWIKGSEKTDPKLEQQIVVLLAKIQQLEESQEKSNAQMMRMIELNNRFTEGKK